MIAAVLSLAGMGVVLGGLLGYAARHLAVDGNPLRDRIEDMLPGSQCGQCGYPGCGPAAQALADGQARPTLCPPGGRGLAGELADLLGASVDPSELDDSAPMIAHVHESLCIGCTKCFKRCPTDAVVGASRQIHSIFADACTGCRKCFDVCPTECIEMRPVQPTLQTWHWPKPTLAI